MLPCTPLVKEIFTREWLALAEIKLSFVNVPLLAFFLLLSFSFHETEEPTELNLYVLKIRCTPRFPSFRLPKFSHSMAAKHLLCY
jgi:hypothetical protein